MAALLDTVLLDRDGTVIENVPYLADPDQAALIPGVGEALGLLVSRGFALYTVSNQSGIGRGYLARRDYLRVQDRMRSLLGSYGAALSGEACCPHAPQEGCACRKPATGMWESLRRRHGLVPERSVMIGDKLSDVRFGKRAGLCASVLVLTGHGPQEAERIGLRLAPGRSWSAEDGLHREEIPHILARDLPAAVRWILARNKDRRD
jgi:D-glycero-D-manno-heptose 1,7-bisphosphate phosphatase